MQISLLDVHQPLTALGVNSLARVVLIERLVWVANVFWSRGEVFIDILDTRDSTCVRGRFLHSGSPHSVEELVIVLLIL